MNRVVHFLSEQVRFTPAELPFSGRIHECDTALFVQGIDSFTQASGNDLGELQLLPELLLGLLALGRILTDARCPDHFSGNRAQHGIVPADHPPFT